MASAATIPVPADLDDLLRQVSALEGTDLFLIGGSPPTVNVQGEYRPLSSAPLTSPAIGDMLAGIMTEAERKTFEAEREFNAARTIEGAGRYRVNAYRQRGEVGVVVRRLATEIPTLKSLFLPKALEEMVLSKSGIVLVTGSTGSGKSTTMAAMIHHRNTSMEGHIITIEDPIEFVHRHRKGIVSQREVGIDTESFHVALKQALRQAPEVVLIGEIRDRDVAAAALHFSDTGHLVLATLHSTNAPQTLERMVQFFPADMHRQILLLLSLNLRGIVSQRLVRAKEGGRVATLEVLLPTPRIQDLIRAGEIEDVREAMIASGEEGIQTFDQALLSLVRDGRITQEEGERNADSPSDLRLRLRLDSADQERDDGIRLAD